ncbi:MAG TPA: class F sortase [Acidimicrobiales bacterium]|jgi:sortase (surface protein transpeptidase)
MRFRATGLAVAVVLTACAGNDETGDRASTRSPASSSTSAPAPSSTSVTSPAATPTTAPPATAEADGMASGTPARVRIPRIGVDAPVVDLGKNPDGTLEVPDWQDAGWWERGPQPGERGPAVIVAHVDSTAGPAAFYRLREVVPGDVVEVDLDGGGTARFVVQRLERFPKDAFPTFDVYGLTPGPELRLITCDGEFDASTGHYVDNLVVFATPG